MPQDATSTTNTTHTRSSNTRFYEIDLLRFVAAFMVVLFHYIYVSQRDSMTPAMDFHAHIDWAHYLYIGINFFFIISGFVILMSAKDKEPRSFFVSRFVRLMPAYWFCVIATSIAILAFNQDGVEITLSQFLVNLSMLQTGFGFDNIDTSYWTLWLELKFYGAIWLLCLLGWLKHIKHILLVTLIASIAALLTPFQEQFERFGNMFVVSYPHWWGYFACGCTFYLIKRDGFLNYYKVLLALSLVFVIIQNIAFGTIMSGWFAEPFSPWVLVPANLIFFALFCVIALTKTNPLRNKVFLYLGVLTYPLYLIHQFVGYLWLTYAASWANHYLLLGVTVATMLAAAWAIHHWVEKPLSKVLHRHLNKRTTLPLVTSN